MVEDKELTATFQVYRPGGLRTIGKGEGNHFMLFFFFEKAPFLPRGTFRIGASLASVKLKTY